MRKRVGPRIQPLETPALTTRVLEDQSLITTFRDPPVRKDFIIEKTLLVIPQLKSLCSKPLCHTLSKAFKIPNAMVLEMCVSSRALLNSSIQKKVINEFQLPTFQSTVMQISHDPIFPGSFLYLFQVTEYSSHAFFSCKCFPYKSFQPNHLYFCFSEIHIVRLSLICWIPSTRLSDKREINCL